MDYSKTQSQESVSKAAESLKSHGIDVIVAKNGEEAKKKVFELIPAGAEVMNMTSITLSTLGIAQEITESGKYNSVRTKLNDPSVSKDEKRKLGAAPDYVVGSVHAVTEDGSLVIASNTGSQLPAYAYAGGKVIWVVGTQKIVKDFNQALDRVYKYVLPLESDRANKAYNMTAGSFVSKLLVINKEVTPGRLTVIFVPEQLGF